MGAGVHLSPTGLTPGWIEFMPQPVNPGVVPANTLYQDDGSNYIASTLVWDGSPSAFATNFAIGPVGTEQGGINVQGVNFDATAKINDIGGTLDAMLILHRHSTSVASNLIFARTNSDTAAHAAVTPGQTLSSVFHMAWSGSHYDIAARIDVVTPVGGTVSSTSLPGQINFSTTPDLTDTPVLAMSILEDQSVVFLGSTSGIDHTELASIGVNSHAAIDTHIADGTIHFTEASIDHTAILNIGVNSHAAIDTHIADVGGASTIHGVVTDLNLSGLFGTILNLVQTGGASPISVDLAAALGLSSLQTLYGVDPAIPQIIVDAVPNTFTFDGSVVGDILAVRDLAAVDVMRISGTEIAFNRAIQIDYDTFQVGQPQFAMTWDPTASITTNYIGGALSVDFNFLVSTGVYIPATFSDTSVSRMAASPAFAAYTFINQLANIRNEGNFNLPSGLIMNIGLTHERVSVGTSTAAGVTGLSFQSQTKASLSGAIMTQATQTAVRFAPTFSTVLGATANLGVLTGLSCVQPLVGFFQPSGGAETMTSYVGLDFAAFTFGGAGREVDVIRSALAASVNARFLNNLGTAESDFGSGHVHFNDNAFLKFGGTNVAFDAGVFWATATESLTISGGRLSVAGAINYPPISPGALAAGDNDDWDGLGTDAFDLTMRHWVRISGNVVTSVITGIDATDAQDGDSFEMTNVSANSVDISHQGAGSAAANRIISPTGVTYQLGPDETVRIRYDATTARWRLLGGTGA